MTVGRKRITPDRVCLGIQLTPKMRDAVHEIAMEQGCTMSELLRHWIREHLDSNTTYCKKNEN